MVGSIEVNSLHSNGSFHNCNGLEEKLDELRGLLGKADGDPLRIVSVGAGAWGSVFAALLQDSYGSFRDKFQIRIWRRPGRAVDRATAEHLFEVINSREDVLRRLIRRCAYLKYVEARLGDRTLYADEILKDGFCLNMIDTPLCPLKVVTNLQEAVWDADIVVNGLPSTETREVFEEINKYWKERITVPIIISLAKGIEAALEPVPHIITPTRMINSATGLPIENILYLGGPNIASEIYNKEYANARICGAEKWRKPLAKFLRQPHFIVWDNSDLVTHEVMGGLKNVYAIGAGMVAALTNESATSKSVYFAHCTSEMIFITHLLAEEPEKLAGPLLADTYVTLLKGRNAWYGQMLAKGEISRDMGENIRGKGMIQGVSAVGAFYELLSQSSLSVLHPEENKPVAPAELCPILKTLYKILITREESSEAILQALRDETLNDPRERIEIAQTHSFYRPSLLGFPLSQQTRFPLHYAEPCFGGLLTPAYVPQVMGIVPARVPLPLDMKEDGPIYVNAKQYHAILRRRKHRAKLEAQNKLIKARKPYLHESRHLHALKRARGTGGRFLNTKKLQDSKSTPADRVLDGSGSRQLHVDGNMSESEVHHPENCRGGVYAAACSDITSASTSDNLYPQQEFRFSGYPSRGGGTIYSQSGGLHHLSVLL